MSEVSEDNPALHLSAFTVTGAETETFRLLIITSPIKHKVVCDV